MPDKKILKNFQYIEERLKYKMVNKDKENNKLQELQNILLSKMAKG